MPRLVAVMLSLVVAWAGCSAVGAEKTAVLHVYTWSEYFAPEVLEEFEEAYDCHVAIDLFDSNEAMYEELVNGEYRYDLVTPSSYMSTRLYAEGMASEIDRSLVPNVENIDPSFLVLTEDPEMIHSIPYTRTVSGLGYNARDLPDFDPSWAAFGDRRFADRITMLDDMRESIGAALKYLGHSLNTVDDDQLAEAERLLMGWKRNLARFEVDESQVGLSSGELLASHGYNGDMARLMEGDPDMGFRVPREGAAITSDDFVILADAENRLLAHAFINHMLDPRVAAVNMESIQYFMPNLEAVDMLPEGLRENPAFSVPKESIMACEVIRDLGEDTRKYEAIWERVTGEE